MPTRRTASFLPACWPVSSFSQKLGFSGGSSAREDQGTCSGRMSWRFWKTHGQVAQLASFSLAWSKTPPLPVIVISRPLTTAAELADLQRDQDVALCAYGPTG